MSIQTTLRATVVDFTVITKRRARLSGISTDSILTRLKVRLRGKITLCPAVETEEIRDVPDSVLFLPFFDTFALLPLVVQLHLCLFWRWGRSMFRGSLAGTPAP
jgi:hypothetical protein